MRRSGPKPAVTFPKKLCSVPNCSSSLTKEISLHNFPKNVETREIWRKILKIGKPISPTMQVCNLHFTKNDFSATANQRRRLNKSAIPTRNLPETTDKQLAVSETSYSIKKKKIKRPQRHRLQKCSIGTSKEIEQNKTRNGSLLEPEPLNKSKIDQQSNTLNADNKDLQNIFKLPLILTSDEKLSHFTGINNDILETILECTRATADITELNDIEVRIILVLCKLKLNIPFECLAILFNMTNSLCRDTFYSTVRLLADCLQPAIYWPDKEEIQRNMPKCFKQFNSTRLVLDFMPIKIEKSKCFKCNLLSYSPYNRTHTLKYLIGITPSGLISFLSAGYGGRISGKAIFNYEKIIDQLDRHDAIMVDKKIVIEDECKTKRITLFRPSSLLGKERKCSTADIEFGVEITRARIHVDRTIERVKQFKILHDEFNCVLLPYVDEIMRIIAAVVNLFPPISVDSEM